MRRARRARPGTACFSSRRMARASRAVGPIFAGVDACPPRPSTVSSSEVAPFSVTPMTRDRRLDARERLVRDRAALVEDEPRAYAAAYQLRDRGGRRRPGDLLVAAEREPDVLGGGEVRARAVARRPRRCRPGSPCRRGCRGPRSRRRRCRRRTAGAARAPPRRPGRRRGGPSARPAGRRRVPRQRKSRPWVWTRVSSSRSWSSGNCALELGEERVEGVGVDAVPGRGARRWGCGPVPAASPPPGQSWQDASVSRIRDRGRRVAVDRGAGRPMD